MNKFVEYRREFHHFAEIEWHEIRTSARVAEILESMGYSCLLGSKAVNLETIDFKTLPENERKSEMERAILQGAKPEYVKRTEGFPGVVAELDTGRPGKVTTFRFDMDALPYDEPKKAGYRPFDEGFSSCNHNCNHACGHDSHIAIGLGLASEVLRNKDQLTGKIRFLFQPAEESYKGAQSMVDLGHLDDVDNFISVHVALTSGGVLMNSHSVGYGCNDFISVDQLDVTFYGKAAHPCGASHDGKNALLAACTAVLNIHAIAPHEEGLIRVNVGKLNGGVASNVIVPEAEMTVEFRGQNQNIANYARKRVLDIIDGAAKMYDIEYSYKDYGEVPACTSDDEMMDVISRAAEKTPWFKNIYREADAGGSDDACIMMKYVKDHGGKATYVGLGTNVVNPVHNPEFDMDEDVIPASIEMLTNAVIELNGK